jgi:hypothetical protein
MLRDLSAPKLTTFVFAALREPEATGRPLGSDDFVAGAERRKLGRQRRPHYPA